MGDLSKHFNKSELSCHCGCGFCISDSVFLARLDLLRDKLGVPIVITSGARCQTYNNTLSESKSNSAHTLGLAVDMSAGSSVTKYSLIRQAIQSGFRRIGVGANFVHIDSDSSKPQEVLWTY
jgi:uncharacterized protein YcbK (DUF882 family)